MQNETPSLSQGKFKLVKNNKDIIELSEKMTVIYLDDGGDQIQLMVDMPQGLILAPNVLVRQKLNDLILDYMDGADAKKIIVEDFFLASDSNPHHLKLAHPDNEDFFITSNVEPVQPLDDGSALIYLYGEHTVLAGLVESYLIDHYYEFDTYEKEEEAKNDKVAKEENEEDGSFTLGQKAGALLGLSAAGIVGRQIFIDRNKSREKEDAPEKTASPETEKTIESIVDVNYTLVEGVITLGPVVAAHGLSVQVMSETGHLLSIVDVDDNGYYSLWVGKAHQQIKLVLLDKSESPDYRDEATGETKSMTGFLSAWATIDGSLPSNIVHINPLTTLAVDLALTEALRAEQGLSNAQLSEINRQVAKAFLGRDVDITRYNIEPAIDQTGYALKGNEGGAVLALISAFEAKSSQTTDEVIESLVAGLSMNNGLLTISAEVVQQLSDAQAFLDDKFGDTGVHVVERIRAATESTNALPVSRSQERYIDEDTTLSFGLADFVFNDGNSEDSLQTVTFISLPEMGHIELAGEAVVAGQVVTAADVPQLIFHPVGNDSSRDYGRLVFNVSDGAATSVEQHIDIHVIEVNDKPATIEAMIGEVAEDVAFTVSEAKLLTLVNDIDSDILSIQKVEVDSEKGQVVYNGDSTWTFTPAADLIDDALPLSIIVSDKKITETFNTFLKITNVNDAPFAKDDGYLPTPLVPVLQSNDEQGLRVTSSASKNESIEPFQAFDGMLDDNLSDSGRWVSAETSGWLQVDFGQSTTIYRYDMSGGENPLYAPMSWQLLGSQDGVDYTVLDTQEAVSGFEANKAQSFILLTPASYQFFKWVVTENQGGDYLILDQMQLYPATIDIDVNTTEDLPFHLDLLKNDHDIDPNDVITLQTAQIVDENNIAIQDSGMVTIVDNQLVFAPSAQFEHLPEDGHTLVKVIYTIHDLAGESSEAAVYLRVNGVNDLSMISGDLIGSVIEDADIDTTTGSLIVTDVDSVETMVPQIVAGDYGVFTLLASGQWSYQLDNTTEALELLHDDRQLQEVFTVAASDGVENTVTVTIQGHTDHDALIAADNTLILNEDSSHTFSAADFSLVDIDLDAHATVSIDMLPAKGSLMLNGNPLVAGQPIAINALANLVFTPVTDASGAGYDQLTFSVNDGLEGGAASYHIDFDVTPVNDSPVLMVPESMTAAAYNLTSLDDLSNRNASMTLNNGALIEGSGVNLNGAGASIGALNIGGDLTIAATFTYDQFSTWASVIDFGNGADSDNILIGSNALGKITAHYYVDSTLTASMSVDDVYTLNETFHLAFTVGDDGHMRLYKNGVEMGEHAAGVAPIETSRASNLVGESNWSNPNTQGRIDDLVVIDRDLSAAEIQTLYQSVSNNNFSLYTQLDIIEEGSADGTVVGTILAADVDLDTLTLSLNDDAGGRFAIHSATGELTVADGALLDFGSQSSHDVKVKVSDGTVSATQTYTILLSEQSVVSGPAYQLWLEGEDQTLSLLEPVNVGDSIYYTLDANQDNQITAADLVSQSALKSLMGEDNGLVVAGTQLTLPSEQSLLDAGFMDTAMADDASGINFWPAPEANEGYTLLSTFPLDEQQTEGFVIYQVIG